MGAAKVLKPLSLMASLCFWFNKQNRRGLDIASHYHFWTLTVCKPTYSHSSVIHSSTLTTWMSFEHLLWVRHCSRYWGYRSGHNQLDHSLHGTSVIGEDGERADSCASNKWINKVISGNNRWKKKIKQEEGIEIDGSERVSGGNSGTFRKASLRSWNSMRRRWGWGGAFPTEKQVQSVLSTLFVYISHFATVQGWLSKAAQWETGVFFPWRMFDSEPMFSATVFYCLVEMDCWLSSAWSVQQNRQTNQLTHLRSGDQRPDLGSHSGSRHASPRFQTWVIHTQSLQKEGEARFKNIHFFLFHIPKSYQSRAMANQWVKFKKITIKK